MKIAIPKEILPEERVAMTPDAVKRLTDSGFEVWVEKGAGLGASCTDTDYTNAGAKIAPSHQKLFAGAEIILKVNPPKDEKGRHEIDDYPSGSVLISFLEIMKQPELAAKLAKKGITALAMETLPRITRAQSMDALSSQASAAGYKAVLWAAKESKKFFPMLTTAAGTIRPAKVFVIGAGVAGLQAIATAHRLGAVVEAFDIRPAAKIEVESLGAKFVQAELEEETEAGGGYAKEVSQGSQERIKQTVYDHVAAADVVITTAQVPGKRAPRIVTRDMIEAMKPGSVVLDMAVDQGGNCDLTEAGKTINHEGVMLIGPVNLASDMAIHSSQMYARNISALLKLLLKDGALQLDFTDEIIKSTCITHAGQVIHEQVKSMLNIK